ncbi:hypothetical protein HOE31_01825 [bacterium]|jgi:hypothetical protein|nr:hypothetical protein [bacterium]MBT4121669.1 hypothetical protein [bacterium]MBT4335147.1 hypothetical protein [bacterium]MBT4495554.1 hypothetical protein [bacterium]MBT4764212.1 hypothetical protein [bacterium]
MKTLNILILEDDLKTLSIIMDRLFKLEEELFNTSKPLDFSVTVFSTYIQVKDYVNSLEKNNFDLIILDKDCKLGGSFHVLDLNKFNVNNVIAISTNVEYNEEVEKLGVKHVVRKDYMEIDKFGDEFIKKIKELI